MFIKKFLEDMYKTFILHAVVAHFPNGLIPAAFFFMLLAVVTIDPFYEHTVLHLIAVSLCFIPVSFVSGIRDWRNKFKGVRAPIFIKKITLSLFLFVFCCLIVVLRISHPDILYSQGLLRWIYILLVCMTIPLVVLLGHYGGKLSPQARRT